MSVEITANNVVKKFGDNVVIPGLDVKIKEGEFFTLLGPSGCGKTTFLRMIAGFNTIDGGTISFGDTVINDKPTHKRNIGMVFQNYAIFPHMNTFDNVAYGLKNRKVSKEEIDRRVREMLKLVQIEELVDRMPQRMSGGQQQRVALARAMVISPDVLLMDEPLSNLDAKLRIEMRYALREMHNDLGITTVYVTHDQEEALAISDRIAVMKLGVIQQCDTPENIYQKPTNLYVGSFIGRSNVFEADYALENGKPSLAFETNYKMELNKQYESDDAVVKVLLRPTELTLSDVEGIKATVTQKNFLGEVTQYILKTETDKVIEVDFNELESKLSYEIGDAVFCKPKGADLKLFDYGTELRIGTR